MSGEQTSFLAAPADTAAAATTTTAEATAAVSAAAPADQSTAEVKPQATAGQTAAAQTEAAPAASGGADAPKPAPVEVKVPEGVELDGGLLAAIKEGKPQDIVDAYLKAEERQRLEVQAQNDQWRKAVEADKELGGTHLPETKAAIGRYMTKFGSPELVKLFQSLGIDNHPEVVRSFARVGRAMGEDTVAGTTAPQNNGSGQTDYRKWFPNSPELNP